MKRSLVVFVALGLLTGLVGCGGSGINVDSHEGPDSSDVDWECESGEQEMCWEWTSDASQHGCGPGTETSSDSTQERLEAEHCWETQNLPAIRLLGFFQNNNLNL